MSMQPSISVLMPVRDALETVEAAIASVQAQTIPDWELVIVDDGSRDGTVELLRQIAALEPRLILIEQEPQGIVIALNRGLASCQGEFVARMDADDGMSNQRLDLQSAFLAANRDFGLVSCRIRFGGTEAGYAAHVDWINSLMNPDEVSLRRFVESPVAHPSVMFRRELIERHGGYRNGPFPEDYELWLRWLEAGVRFGKIDAELMVWNDPPQRLSRTDSRYSVEAFYATKCLYLTNWLKKHVNGRELWLWGAGRITRRRFDSLPIVGFIDVDAAKCGTHCDGRVVRLANDLPECKKSFILAGVGARGAREAIQAHLVARGWMEGRDFLLVA